VGELDGLQPHGQRFGDPSLTAGVGVEYFRDDEDNSLRLSGETRTDYGTVERLRLRSCQPTSRDAADWVLRSVP